MIKLKKKLAVVLLGFLALPLINAVADPQSTCMSLVVVGPDGHHGTHWSGTLSNGSSKVNMSDFNPWGMDYHAPPTPIATWAILVFGDNINVGTTGVCVDTSPTTASIQVTNEDYNDKYVLNATYILGDTKMTVVDTISGVAGIDSSKATSLPPYGSHLTGTLSGFVPTPSRH